MDRQIEFTVKENTYTIKLPTIGQLLQIEEQKAIFTNGRYGYILANRTTISESTLDNVDMMAHLTVMCPDLISDMAKKGLSSWKEMSIIDFNELKKPYKDVFVPWFKEFEKQAKG